MATGTAYGMPGVDAIRQTVEYDLIWGGDRNQVGVLQQQGNQFSSAIVDAGSTPTTDIRAGLLLALDANNELVAWDADAATSAADLIGVNSVEFSTLDADGTAVDKFVPSPIVRAPLRAASLLIQGVALVGHTDEFAARRQLHLMGCMLDDDPQGLKTGLINRTVVDNTAALTPTTAQNGTTFLLTLDGTVAVTLPVCQPDLTYTFWRHNDTNLSDTEGAWSVATAAGADVLLGEAADAASGNQDTLTYTTANEHQGSWIKVRGIYHSTTAKWLVEKNDGRTYAFSVT